MKIRIMKAHQRICRADAPRNMQGLASALFTICFTRISPGGRALAPGGGGEYIDIR
jgi:hypothetical protein